jgi:accessory gene regulator protein AgrB
MIELIKQHKVTSAVVLFILLALIVKSSFATGFILGAAVALIILKGVTYKDIKQFFQGEDKN